MYYSKKKSFKYNVWLCRFFSVILKNMADPQNKSYGYGKRPLWQWILLYVVIGAIIYGLIYFFVFAKKVGYNTGQYQQPTTTQTAPNNNGY